jgi:hypothetical protein
MASTADDAGGNAGLRGEWAQAKAAPGTADQGQADRERVERAGESPGGSGQGAGIRAGGCGGLSRAARQ